jgi:type I restriction enzyme S subunit
MGSEWKTVRLGDHVDASLGKMLDKNKNRGTLHPYLGNKQVRWGSFDLDDLAEMKFEDHEHDRYGLSFGDLVVCEGGEPGRCALWRDEVPNMKIQKALHRIRPHSELNSTFLHYWFCYAGKFELLEPYFTGTTIQHLTGKAVAELPIPLPPLPEQKAIAHILGTLDDKIELNRQMNATLEGMAQALFKSWFVDFDPVIDNAITAGNPIPDELAPRAEVRRQALANGTANREAAKPFPDSFQETESMGWIPEGWQVGQMSDHALIEMGQSPKGDTYNAIGEGMPLVNGPVEFGSYFTNKSKWTTSPTKRSNKNDLIVCVRGSTTGRFVKSDGEYCLGRGVCSVRAKSSQCFVDQIFKSSIAKMLGLTTGSTFPNWSRHTLSGFETITPPNSITERFEKLISPKIGRIESGVYESETLSRLRDTLLPKLISGELRVSEAEQLTVKALA